MPPFDPTRRGFLLSLAAAGLSAQELGKGPNEQLLDEVARRGTSYFWEMADPNTGLVLDKASVEEPYRPGVSSIAATGFGLSALCIGDARGYLNRDEARARVHRTLEYLNTSVEHEHGFFYHFIYSSTGRRVWQSEASSIDTGWLLCGALHCRTHWEDPEIRRLASALLARTDWKWMLNGSRTLSHGWTPEAGFLPWRWDTYAELLAMYLLAISAEKNGIPATSWDALKRPMTDFQGIFFIDAATPIFVHQYSHAWFDFRDRRDRYANYFRNSQRATQAHREYCIKLASRFPWYGPDMWGVTASDSAQGYRVWGSPASPPDGTLVPCAAGGSMAFLPTLCSAVLENMRKDYGVRVWSRYGFVDAFQPHADWYCRYVIGIDLGIMLLMAENTVNGTVWDTIMSTPEAKRGMDAVGLKPVPA